VEEPRREAVIMASAKIRSSRRALKTGREHVDRDREGEEPGTRRDEQDESQNRDSEYSMTDRGDGESAGVAEPWNSAAQKCGSANGQPPQIVEQNQIATAVAPTDDQDPSRRTLFAP